MEGVEVCPFAATDLVLHFRHCIVALRGVAESEREIDRSERRGDLTGLSTVEGGGHLEPAVRRHRGGVFGSVTVEVARDETEGVRRGEVDQRLRDSLVVLLPGNQRLPDHPVVGRDKRIPPVARGDADGVLRLFRVAVRRRAVVVARANSHRGRSLLDHRRLRRHCGKRMAGFRVNRHTRRADFVRRIDSRSRHLAVRRHSTFRPGRRTRLRPAVRHHISRRAAVNGQLHRVRCHAMDRRRRRDRQRPERERPRNDWIAGDIRRRDHDGILRIGGKPGRRDLVVIANNAIGHKSENLGFRTCGRDRCRHIGDARRIIRTESKAYTRFRGQEISVKTDWITWNGECVIVRNRNHINSIRTLYNPSSFTINLGVVWEVTRFPFLRGVWITRIGVVVDLRPILDRIANP